MTTSKKVAKKAAKELAKKQTPKSEKSVAASDLDAAKPPKPKKKTR